MEKTPKSDIQTSVIISLWNYREFVEESLKSVLNQSKRIDEIIVVDDGSTDGGEEIVSQMAEKDPRIQLVRQPNMGQLAAFQKGIELSQGEIIFFLDADDLWETDHTEKICKVFDEHPRVDFVFTGYQEFGRSDRAVRPYGQDLHLGLSILVTYYNRNYIGSITSTNAVRRRLLEELFPIPDDVIDRCRINADAYLIFGSSLAGATKYYLNSTSVRYRIHQKNNYQGRYESPVDRYKQVARQWQTIDYLGKRLNLSDELRFELLREFESVPVHTKRIYKRALQTLRRLRLPLMVRSKLRFDLFVSYHFRKR